MYGDSVLIYMLFIPVTKVKIIGEGVSCYTIAEFVLYFIDVMHICTEREGILISS